MDKKYNAEHFLDTPAELYVDQSTIPNAGNGLFAAVSLPPNTSLGWYIGRPLTKLTDALDNDRVLTISQKPPWMSARAWRTYARKKRNKELLMLRAEHGFMSHNVFANDIRNSRKVNCEIWADGEYVTTRRIKEGSEIFVSYGSEYWKPERQPKRH